MMILKTKTLFFHAYKNIPKCLVTLLLPKVILYKSQSCNLKKLKVYEAKQFIQNIIFAYFVISKLGILKILKIVFKITRNSLPAQTVQNQPKYQIPCHKNSSPGDLYSITLMLPY